MIPRKAETTNEKGARTEGVILGELVKRGLKVLVPFGVEKYDLAIDLDGQLVRIQCKTGRLRNGCVVFNTSAARTGAKYHGHADAFGVYCAELQTSYLVPMHFVGERLRCFLRIDPTKNNQQVALNANEFNIDFAAAMMLTTELVDLDRWLKSS